MSDITFLQRINRVGPSLLSTTNGIDLKSVVTTNLYIVPSGSKAIITGAIIRPTLVDTFAVAATLGIGIAAGEADIILAAALTGLTTTSSIYPMLPIAVPVIGLSGNIIKVGVDVGATATTFSASIDLLGYLI